MMKLLIFIFLCSFTRAEEIGSDVMDSIFIEGVLFIILFLTMWVISFFISTKHAQKYEKKNPLHERRAVRRKRELIERFLTISHLKDRDNTAALLWLSKLLKKNIIDEEEFEILKESLSSSLNR